MGAWNTKLTGNDTFQDIYQSFFDLYNQGLNPAAISKQIQEDFAEQFNDYDDRNNCLFALALAQWETKSLDPSVYNQVKALIETGKDLEVWKGLGADEKTLQQRKVILDKFLTQISSEKEKPKPRVKQKVEFTTIELIKAEAPDNNKVVEVSEFYTNGVYDQTGSAISWESGGGAVFYFTGQGQFISARWLDSQTLEVKHDKNIVFTKKETTFFYRGDQGKIIYSAE